MTTRLQTQTRRGLWLSRVAVSGVFFIHGAVFANWAARIPDVQARLGLSEGGLGLGLLGMSLGVLTALPLAGGFIGRFGSRKMSVIAGSLYGPMLILPGLAGSFWVLFGALFIFGFVGSVMDMSMNAQGVEVERRFGRSIISSLHALYSLGLAFGALVAGWLVGQPVPVHFAMVGVVAAPLCLLMWPSLYADRPAQGDPTPAFSLPPRVLWLVGAVSFFAVIAEGGLVDWSVKYMRDVVGMEAGRAAFGLTALSLAMTAGRFGGDWLVSRFDRVTVVRGGGLLAAVGLGLVVAVPSYAAGLLGLALAGLGLATIVPLTFSAGGNVPGLPSGVGIAGVATIGYSGILVGPPLIGFVAEGASLRASFLLLVVLMLVMAAGAGALRTGKARP